MFYPFTVQGIVKGTGTGDYNWLKVVLYDGPWLGENPADTAPKVSVEGRPGSGIRRSW